MSGKQAITNLRLYYLIFIAALLVSASVEANPILTATCNDPKGQRFDYGRGLLGEHDLKLEKSEDSFSDSNPTFIIDDEKPAKLLVIWRPTKSVREVSGKPTKATEAIIILATEHHISAIERYPQAIWVYSLYPKLGLGYFSTHRHHILGYEGTSITFYAMCQFVSDDPTVTQKALPPSSRGQVRQAQQKLKDMGLYAGTVDGIAGPRTAEALRLYQRIQGLPMTGELDEATRKALGKININ